VNPLLRKALHAEVSLIRVPLKVLDDRVVARYTAADSRVRHTFQTALAAVDQAAGMLADAPGQAQAPTADRPTGTSGSPKADSSTTAGSGATAGDTAAEPPVRLVPGEPMPEPAREEVEELVEELVEEQEEETFAGELADDDELRRVQAELQAKRLVEESLEQQSDAASTDNG
jgi:hypothetical protein